MNFLKALRLPPLIFLMFFVTACADGADGGGNPFASLGIGPTDTGPMTPAEQRLRDDNQVFNETVMGGAATGALQGALLGLLVGLATGDAQQALAGAAIGAGVGAVAGGIDGWRVASKQEASRKQIREIELVTDKVEEENRRSQQAIDNMDLVIADTTRSLRSGRAGLRSQTVTAEEVARREARARKNIAQIDELIEGIEERNREYAKISGALRAEGEDTRQIDRDLAETNMLLERRKRERDLLVQELAQGTIA